MRTTIEVRTEPHAFVGNFAQLTQAENLEAARIGKHSARPTHETMQPAHAPDSFVTRPQIKVISVAEDDLRAQTFQHILRYSLD